MLISTPLVGLDGKPYLWYAIVLLSTGIFLFIAVLIKDKKRRKWLLQTLGEVGEILLTVIFR